MLAQTVVTPRGWAGRAEGPQLLWKWGPWGRTRPSRPVVQASGYEGQLGGPSGDPQWPVPFNTGVPCCRPLRDAGEGAGQHLSAHLSDPPLPLPPLRSRPPADASVQVRWSDPGRGGHWEEHSSGSPGTYGPVGKITGTDTGLKRFKMRVTCEDSALFLPGRTSLNVQGMISIGSGNFISWIFQSV